MKPFYDEDGITIYHADCRDILPQLSDIDLVVTSPPYNLGAMRGGKANLSGGYLSHDDKMPQAEYDDWQRGIIRTLWALVAPNGAIFYNHKPIPVQGETRLPVRLIPDGVTLRQVIIWYRRWGVNWSPSHFLPVHEWVLLLAHPDFRLRDRAASGVGDVWDIRPDMSDAEHPASFPLALPVTAIAATDAQTILDPFMGSGTTLRAAKDLGRKAIDIEIEERYCEIAVKRLAQGVLPL